LVGRRPFVQFQIFFVVFWVVVFLLVLFRIFIELFRFDVDDIGVIFRVRGGRLGGADILEG